MAWVKKKVKEEEKIEEAVVSDAPEHKLKVTYIGPGGLGGEYLFKEFAGSIVAPSLEEAIKKAEELATKHPDLLVK